MGDKQKIVCFGEVLWDSLPAGLFLGGAPLNVCYHLNQLGIKAEMCSKVGNDRLGKEALRRIKKKGISIKNIQQDDVEETGFVEVEMTEEGEPSYDIIEPVAWDLIELTPALQELADDSWGVVFGTLAQRNDVSKGTIRELWKHDCRKILDLNLRPPYDNKKIIHDSLKAADIVKMNDDELNQMKDWFDLPAGEHESVESLADHFGSSLVCITKGANGAILFQDGYWFEHSGYQVKAKDSVGAGDAFFAALIYGIQHDRKGKELLKYANATGSLVATKSGATPEYSFDSIEKIMSS